MGVALTVVLLASLTVGLSGVPAGAATSNLKFTKLELPLVEDYNTTSPPTWTYFDAIDPDAFADSEGDFWCTPAADLGPIAVTPDGDILFAAVADGFYMGSNWYHVLKSTDGGYSWVATGYYEDVVEPVDGYDDDSYIVDIVTSPEYDDDTTLLVASQYYVYISDDSGKNFIQLDDPWSGDITDLDVTVAEDGDLAIMVSTDNGEVWVAKGLLAWTNQDVDGSLPATDDEALAGAFLPTFAADGDIGICAIVTDYDSPWTTTMIFSFADISDGGEWGDDIANAPFTSAEGDDFDSDWARIAFPDDFDAFGIGNNVCFAGLVEDGSLGALTLEADPPDGSDAYKVICKEAGTSSAIDLDVRGVLTTLLPTATGVISIDVCGEAEEATILVGTDAINLGDTPTYWSAYTSEDSGENWVPSMKCPTGGAEAYPDAEYYRVNTRVLMAPDFCDSGVAYASTWGFKTDAFQRTTDGGESFNQISIIDYGDGVSGYAVTGYGLNAGGYIAEGTLLMLTQLAPDSFMLIAGADDSTATVVETTAGDDVVSVAVIIDADGDATAVYDGTDTYTIDLPDTGDTALVSAVVPNTNVTWTETAGTVTAQEANDIDGDMTVGASGASFTMYDASNLGALWQRIGKHWERILSYATPGVTDTLFQCNMQPMDGSALFAADLNNAAIWRSTDGGATWPKKISTKDFLTWVTPVSSTTLYTGHADGEIWWTTRSGTGWNKPDDSEIPGAAMVVSVTVMGDIVTCGTNQGSVFISSDGGENVERVGKTGPFDMGDMVLEGPDLGFGANGMLYATGIGLPEVYRCEVDLGDPTDAEWIQIDDYQDSTGDVEYDDTTLGASSPPICLPPSGILYIGDIAPANGDMGGLWRSTNPTADVDSVVPPYFERENNGLDPGDMVILMALDLAPPALAPTIFFWNITAPYYDQIVMFTDILNVGVPLASPTADETGVGLLAEGDVYPEVSLFWQEMAGATSYQYQLAIDPDFKTQIDLSGFNNGFTKSLASPPLTLHPNTTYYWRTRVANESSLIGAPLISPWSETWKFKTAIGAAMARPILQAPEAGEHDVPLVPTFEWSGIEWAEVYEYELALDPTTGAGGYFADPLVSLTGTNALVSTAWKCDRTLDYNTRYYWQVKAIGVDTDTPWSDVGTFTTMSEPAPPTEVGPEIVIPPAEEITPAWIWAIVIIGAILVIAVIVLIVTTRRVP